MAAEAVAAALEQTIQMVEETAVGRAVELEVAMENLEACRLAAAEETAAEMRQPS